MNLTIRDLTRALKGQLVLGDPKKVATYASVDSRLTDKGSLFFAIKGERVDGHDYAMAACRQGAAAVVVSRLDWLRSDKNLTSAVIRVEDTPEALKMLGQFIRQAFRGPVVGITGSNGKTTTKQMVASVLKALGPGLFTQGNFNSQIGLPLVLSTLKSEDKWMALEMGASAPGHIATLAEMAHPLVGIITSIGPAHLATFGSIKRIAESKWELMESLSVDGCAVVPWGDPHLEPLIRSYSRRIVFFGEDPTCPVRATALEIDEHIRFMLQIGTSTARVRLPLPGRLNVSNALAAAAAGWVLGLSIEQIVQGLETFEPPKMRMEVIRHPSGATLVNDAYNANPASMMHAVRSLVESYPSKRSIAVIGSMKELGDESEKMHFHLGAEMGRFSIGQVYLVGKETDGVREGAVSAGAPKEKFVRAEPEDVVRLLEKQLNSQTVVLFKGSRAMQLERIIESLMPPAEPA